MKTFVAAICLLVGLIAGTFVYSAKMNESVDKLEVVIEHFEMCVQKEEYDNCNQKMAELEACWQTTEKWFKAFMDHRQLDLINHAFYELKGYSAEKNKEEMLVRCGVLKDLLHYVTESETLNLENIF